MTRFEDRKNQSCGHLLVKASRLFFSKSVKEITEKYKLTLTEHHFRVFPYLDPQGTTISEIAQKMKISKQAVSKLVHRLVDEKILNFQKTEDGRQKLVTFQSNNRSAFGKSLDYLEEQDAVFEKILGSRSDLERFKTYLLKIQNFYNKETPHG